MGYQALLFCPDEKTARTVTQVLSELEFSVEPCTEAFAAVKRLMGQHFDAVVVDCDNEQNATLLFKSARNSTSNQASLAVAVVEGQAGVAKAFRIGANLVLTKPINVDQAKGTLRVARGLLRKGDGRPAAPAPTSATPAPQRPATPSAKPVLAEPVTARPTVTPMAPAAAKLPPAVVPAIPAPPTRTPAHSAPTTQPSAAPSAAMPISADLRSVQSTPATSIVPSASGAASAPAPAREAPLVVRAETAVRSISAAEEIVASTAAAQATATDSAASAPSPMFTFGGANALEESKGGSKKALFGLVAVVLVAALAYVGWTYFKGHQTSPSISLTAASTPTGAQPAPVAPKPAPYAVPPAASSGSQSAGPTAPAESAPPAATRAETDLAVGRLSGEDASSAPTPLKTGKAVQVAEPGEAPLVVKGGAAPKANAQPAAPDVPAPSVIGMEAPASAGQLPNLGSASTPKPVLQKLNVSQGVSQGLLLKRVDPSYPPNAVRMQIEGSVQLLATISKTGDITEVKVMSGDKQLARAAVDAVKRWKYAPYLLNGDPVDIQTQITVNFKLPN
jgi:periplasmic protein TonB